MSDLHRYTNPGAIMRQMFPKQLGSQFQIIIWTIVFLLNIVIVILIQYYGFYTISDLSVEGLQKNEYFTEHTVLASHHAIETSYQPGAYYVFYESNDNEMRVVRLSAFPITGVERAHLDKSTDSSIIIGETTEMKDGNATIYITVDEDISVPNINYEGTNFPRTYNTGSVATYYLAIAVVMLLVEFFLYGVFHRLFR